MWNVQSHRNRKLFNSTQRSKRKLTAEVEEKQKQVKRLQTTLHRNNEAHQSETQALLERIAELNKSKSNRKQYDRTRRQLTTGNAAAANNDCIDSDDEKAIQPDASAGVKVERDVIETTDKDGRYTVPMQLALTQCIVARVGYESAPSLVEGIVYSITGQHLSQLPSKSTVGRILPIIALLNLFHAHQLLSQRTMPEVIAAHDSGSHSAEKFGVAVLHIQSTDDEGKRIRDKLYIALRSMPDGCASSILRLVLDFIEDLHRFGSLPFGGRSSQPTLTVNHIAGAMSDHANSATAASKEIRNAQSGADRPEEFLLLGCCNHKSSNMMDAIVAKLRSADVKPLLPAGTSDPSLTAWDVLYKFAKLLRSNGGKQYHFNVAVDYQRFCEYSDIDDILQYAVIQVKGLRSDGRAFLARVVLLFAIEQSDSFFHFLQQLKGRKLNQLDIEVRDALRCPRIRCELKVLSLFSRALFKPLMLAINDDATKTIDDMRAAVGDVARSLDLWSRGVGLNGLRLGMPPAAIGEQIPNWKVLANCASDYYGDHPTQSAFTDIQPDDRVLQLLAQESAATWKRFTREFQPGGPLHDPSPAIKRLLTLAPTENDVSERGIGAYAEYRDHRPSMKSEHIEARTIAALGGLNTWLNGLPPSELQRFGEFARAHAPDILRTWERRHERDAEIEASRIAAKIEAELLKEREAARRTVLNQSVKLWTTRDVMRAHVDSVRSDAAKTTLLLSQLSVYKEHLPSNTPSEKRFKTESTQKSHGGKKVSVEQFTDRLGQLIDRRIAGEFTNLKNELDDIGPPPKSKQSAKLSKRFNRKHKRTTREDESDGDEATETDRNTYEDEEDDELDKPTCCGKLDLREDLRQCERCFELRHLSCEGRNEQTESNRNIYLCTGCWFRHSALFNASNPPKSTVSPC